MKLHKMIEMYLKYDNMHTNGTTNAFIGINNHVNSCINCILSIISYHIHVILDIHETHEWVRVWSTVQPDWCLKLVMMWGGGGNRQHFQGYFHYLSQIFHHISFI